MGRTVGFAFFLLLISAALYLRTTQAPFVAVASDSMKPAFERGDLVFVAPVSPETVQVGDVVVVEVSSSARERYGYPASIVHRVVEVERSEGKGLSFQTKGDNTGPDPFTVYPDQVQGSVGSVYGRAGFIILYLHSTQGLIFLAAGLGIWAFYSFSNELEEGAHRARRRFSQSLVSEAVARIDEIDQRQSERLGKVDESLLAFSEAMKEYAVHLKSHTAAVQAMAAAAHEIRASVAAQGEVFNDLRHLMARQDRSLPPPAFAPPSVVVPTPEALSPSEGVQVAVPLRVPAAEDRSEGAEASLGALVQELRKQEQQPARDR